MYISRKTQLILTDSQKELIDEMIYVRRNLWNKCVEKYNPIITDKLEHKLKNVLPTWSETEKYLKTLDFPKVNNRIYKTCAEDYLQAWKMCFKIKNRRKPHFHSVNSSENRVNFSSMADRLTLKNNSLTLPTKAGGTIKSKTITFCEDLSEFNNVPIPCFSLIKRNNNYYISLTFDMKEFEKKTSEFNQIGCDWGLKTFLTTSNNEQYNLPRSLISQEIRIKHLQKILSKKCKGSKNREKIRIKLNEAWLRYINIRKDFIEKLSYKLLKENELICLEDLDINDMIQQSKSKKRHFNIYKNSFGIFRTRIVQKSERFTSQVVFVNRYFPSSQLCSSCGEIHKEMKDLRRVFKCDCGLEIDRDLNASLNILNEGRKILLIGQ